ncbi:MAG: WhiB family transcriptional regulator [Acidimicrobiia bacterium]|nr:WhiB family transcriptional regulator [Acidimicrobiia bacterium]
MALEELDPAARYELPDLDDLLGRPRWHADAACRGRGPAGWFAVQGDVDTVTAARVVCASCPARVECLSWALAAGPSLAGVWGGTTVTERAELRRVNVVVGRCWRGARGGRP